MLKTEESIPEGYIAKPNEWKYDKIKIDELKETDPVKLKEIEEDIRVNGNCPIDIPENVTVTSKTKDSGYEQIEYKWNDGNCTYRARWHTETPGAKQFKRGSTWVIERKIHGNANGKQGIKQVLIGNDKWISAETWIRARTANGFGRSTPEQKQMLEAGHWQVVKKHTKIILKGVSGNE